MKNQDKRNPFIIRSLQENDIELLGDLYFPWSTRQETVEKWTRYFKEQEKGNRIACIVTDREKIVGYGNLLLSSDYSPFRNNRTPEISDLWVYEENRKKGVGTLLIVQLEKLAKDRGYRQVGLGVGLYRDYGSAQRLYFRLGYRPDGEGITYKNASVIAGEPYPVDDDLLLWLVKPLPVS